MATPENLFFYIQPPTDGTVDAAHKVLTTATGVAAANYSWAVTGLGSAAPAGTCMLTLEASTYDCFVRFKPTNSTAATTAVNGLIIKAGQPGRSFYVSPEAHGFIDSIAPGGTGSLQVQVSSPIGYRINQ